MPNEELHLIPDAGASENTVVYKKYDAKGNPLEVELAGGLTVVFLWGHSQSLPIAKIENTTLSAVLSKFGITEIQLNNLSETSMTAINNLRKTLVYANVYTYTYQPLIGISTQTDPMGQKTTYEYDPFYRLKNILDSKQNKLINYEYNYMK
ncbi:hypothetical protein [Flavobacterium sp. JP2137]|uniref:hypothetical protein n=1 Tax=Flavobacterium sp. JP2137 TaxID=3414510 RepID=UPI003D2FFB58